MELRKWGGRALAMMTVGVLSFSTVVQAAGTAGVDTYEPDTNGVAAGWNDQFDGSGSVIANTAKKMIRVVMPTQDAALGGFGFQVDPNHMIANYAATAEGTSIIAAEDASLYFPNKTVTGYDETTGEPNAWTTVWSSTSDPITAYNKGNVDADITVTAYLKNGVTPIQLSTNETFAKEQDEEGNDVAGTENNASAHMFMTLQDVNEGYANKVLTSAFANSATADDIAAEVAAPTTIAKSITKSIPNVKDSWYHYNYVDSGDAHVMGTFEYVANDGIATAADAEFPSYTFNLRGASNAEADWSAINSAPTLTLVWNVVPGEYADDAYVGWTTDTDGNTPDTDGDGIPDSITVGPKAYDPTAAFVGDALTLKKVTVNGKDITSQVTAPTAGTQLTIGWDVIKAVGEDQAPARRIRVEFTNGKVKAADGTDTDEDIIKAYVGAI